MFERKVDQFKNGIFTWFIGEVKDINDTKNLNRVRVHAYGYYDGVVDVNDYPWATVMMPTTSASIKGNGANHHLEVGSWVVGFFADGPSAQDPIVMGSIATQTDGIPDIPEEAYVNPGVHQVVDAINAGGNKPSIDNKVYKSKAGHKIELDNTSGKETLRVTHAKGAKITIDKDNNLSITNSGTTNITSDGIIRIESKIKTTVI